MTFNPPTVSVPAGTHAAPKIETTVTFPAPGRYTLSIAGSNGRRTNAANVVVNVTR